MLIMNNNGLIAGKHC